MYTITAEWSVLGVTPPVMVRECCIAVLVTQLGKEKPLQIFRTKRL